MFFRTVLFSLALVHAAPIEEDERTKYRVPIDLSYLGDSLYGDPDPESGKKLDEWNEDSEMNADEMGGYAEGDMLFPFKLRSGLISEVFRWKDAEVPYEISDAFPEEGVEMIKKAMDMYRKYTCIVFRPKTDEDTDYLAIVESYTGCWSAVGRVTGRQELNLQQPKCTNRLGIPLHELMHSLGFIHEQSRPERDEYIDIIWDNVIERKKKNFRQYDSDTVTSFGVNYDYSSVMHYSKKAFTANGEVTIIPKAGDIRIGQREGFSIGDIMKINTMYNCSSKGIILTPKALLPDSDPNILTD